MLLYPFVVSALLLAVVDSQQQGYPTCENDKSKDYWYESSYESPWYPSNSNKKYRKKPCQSQHINAFGKYSAHLAPCKIQFHYIVTDENLNPHQLSTACSDKNLVGGEQETTHNTAYEYLRSWKDECVGDFRRCYMIPRDELIFKTFLCSKKWFVPNGTTHISVSCTEDKAEKNLVEETDHYFEKEKKMLKEMQTILVAILVIVLLLFFTCCGLTYCWAVKPYQQNLRLRLAEHRALLRKKNDDVEDTTTEDW